MMLEGIMRVGAHGICQKGSMSYPILHGSSWGHLRAKMTQATLLAHILPLSRMKGKRQSITFNKLKT